MTRTMILAVLVGAAASAQADVITQWNFNGASATTVPGGNASPTPSVGTGTASLLAGITGGFSSGTANGGSSDPVNTTPSNYGWQTTSFPAAGVGSGTAGVQFAVSTAGFQSISVSFDTRHSNTSSAWVRLDWSADGGANWTNGPLFQALAGDTWYNGRASGVLPAAADNNANFVVRMVTVFAPGSAAYAASTSTSTYAGSGTLRWDMVTISGTVVPAPGALALIGLGGLVAARRNRR